MADLWVSERRDEHQLLVGAVCGIINNLFMSRVVYVPLFTTRLASQLVSACVVTQLTDV